MAKLAMNLPDMVDLAVGHPEAGAINYNVLHALLHVLIKQTNQEQTQVQFSGQDADRVKSLQAAKAPTTSIILSNYGIQGGKSPASDVNKVMVQPGNKFDDLEKKVTTLSKHVDEMLHIAGNDVLIATGKDEGFKPNMTNMWNLLTLQKKVEASEKGIEKLLSMIEDLSRKTPSLTGHPPPVQTRAQDSPPTTTTAEPDEQSIAISEIHPDVGPFIDPAVLNKLDTIERTVEGMSERILFVEDKLTEIVGEEHAAQPHAAGSHPAAPAHPPDNAAKAPPSEPSPTQGDKPPEISDTPHTSDISMTDKPHGSKSAGKSPSLLQMKKDVDILKAEVSKLKRKESTTLEDKARSSIGSKESKESVISAEAENVKIMETKIQQLDNMFRGQVEVMLNQITDLERELGSLHEKINTSEGGIQTASDTTDVGGLAELYAKISTLQQMVDNMSNITFNLQKDKEDRETKIEAVLQAVEFLKNIKADKEDLEDALADKADQQTVNRKVSHDQFDAACDDLSRSLEEALAKLTQQEEEWKLVLDNIQVDIGNKLDKNEIHPLRDFVNSKLQSIQDRLRQLIKMKEDTEAAGTRSKILKDVNCISCDKKVVMKRDLDHPPISSHPPLPPNRSMRPYLTYELDAVRKQTKRLPGARNLNDFETAMREEEGRVKSAREDEFVPPEHLCNRYCGGSHTLTTPQQRVTHIGHFLQQWGPEAVPLKEGFSKGTDGKMYKIREDSRPQSGATDDEKKNVKEKSLETITIKGKTKK